MISVFMVAERIVSLRRLGAAMTLLAGATGIGYALGSGIAGRLADAGGHTPAFAVAVTAGALAVALAAVSARGLASRRGDEPVSDRRDVARQPQERSTSNA
jgi:predicted MFS family arabinose efflux permease